MGPKNDKDLPKNYKDYCHPLNIVVYDTLSTSQNKEDFLCFLLGDDFKTLKTQTTNNKAKAKELKDNKKGENTLGREYKVYTHPQLKWQYIPIAEDEIQDCFSQINNSIIAVEKKNFGYYDNHKKNALICQTLSINDDKIIKMFQDLQGVTNYMHPMIIIVSKDKNDTIYPFHLIYQHNEIAFDFRNVVVVHYDSTNLELTKKLIYEKSIQICSYFNQLGDEFMFGLKEAKDKEKEEHDENDKKHEEVNENNINSSEMNNKNEINTNEKVNGQNKISEEKKEKKKLMTKSKLPTNRLNFLVVGNTGSGKSTLINTILGDKRALENDMGSSTTSKITMYRHLLYAISLYDTPGFENEKDVILIINGIKNQFAQMEEEVREIHMILYVKNSKTEKINKNDKLFLKAINNINKDRKDKKIATEDIPIIFVLTKTEDQSLVKEERAQMQFVLQNLFTPLGIFPVELDYTYKNQSCFGMDSLFEKLSEYFEKFLISDDTISKIDTITTEKEIYNINAKISLLSHMDNKANILKSCKRWALGLIVTAAVISAAIGASPIPFADIIALTTMPIPLASSIALIYGIRMNPKELLTNLGVSLTANTVLVGLGKGITGAIKLIPGLGTAAGCAIDSGISFLGTMGLGAAIVKFCERNFDLDAIKKWTLNACKEYNKAIKGFKILQAEFKENYAQNKKGLENDPFED